MLLVSETLVNETKNAIFSEVEPYEPSTDDIGQLFHYYQQEYGRCTSKVYSDRANGETWAIGWVFEKMNNYSDSKDMYLQKSWVTLWDAEEADESAMGFYPCPEYQNMRYHRIG